MKNSSLSIASVKGIYQRRYMLLALCSLLLSAVVISVLASNYYAELKTGAVLAGALSFETTLMIIAVASVFSLFIAMYLIKAIAVVDRLRGDEVEIGTILETMLDAVVTINIAGNILSINKEAEKTFGYNEGELLGKDISILMPEVEAVKHTDYLQQSTSMDSGRVISDKRSVDGVRKNGSQFPIELSVNQSEINGEKVFIGVVRDISETVKNEKALLKALLDAEMANGSKLRFMATMSHEIRTPMSGLLGMLHLLSNTALTNEQRRFLNTASGSGEMLLSVINDVLDFSKMDADKLELESIPFDMVSLAEETAFLLSGPAHKKGLELVCDVDSKLPARLQGDPTRIRQVLANLLNNAIKFTDEGEVVLSVSIKHEKLHICVTDTGLGMTEAELLNIFDVYKQAATSTSRKYGGTGLGLPICKRLVEKMGGSIYIDSIAGQGSAFSLSIPLLDTEQDEVEIKVDVFAKNVLVADKSIASAEAIKHMLMSLGLEKIDVVDTLHGLENKLFSVAGDSVAYDAVFVSTNLDGLAGSELLVRLNAAAGLKPKVVFLSPQNTDKSKYPVAAWLAKPVRRDDMYACLSLVENDSVAMSGELVSQPRIGGEDIRVLLVEDNEINQEVAKEVLASNGYIVEVVDDGVKAVSAVQHNHYDAVLMDIQMPVMDGFEASRKIRELGGEFATLPIIAMTASALSGDREKSLAAGMNDHTTKPINPDEIFETLSRWITKQDASLSESSDAEKIDISALPTLPGIDLESAMDRFCNDWDLYKKILISFREKHADTAELIERSAKQGDWEEAVRISHNLSGTSGNLDAFFIYKQAMAIEEICRNKDLDRAIMLLGRLREYVAEVVAGVDEILLGVPVGDDELDNIVDEKVVDVLDKVKGILATDAGEAHHLLGKINKSRVSSRSIEYLNNIENALFNSDIDRAMLMLDELRLEVLHSAEETVSVAHSADRLQKAII